MEQSALKKQLDIPRELAAKWGNEAVKISLDGRYTSNRGVAVEIHTELERAVLMTQSYPPEQEVPAPEPGSHRTVFEAKNETTLSGVRRLLADGLRPAMLNMASASSPGGGFLHGARAQEEYLCRSSGLYLSIKDNKMYSHPDADNAFGTDWIIFSPNVPVFRDDDGRLMDGIELVSVLTCAAVNANGVRKYLSERSAEIGTVMQRRISRLLRVAAIQRQNSLVLGAWGCGAFGNDSQLIARLFRQAFEKEFRGVFERVVFSVTDWSDGQQFIGPFLSQFA